MGEKLISLGLILAIICGVTVVIATAASKGQAQDTVIDEPRPRSQSINVYVPYQKFAVDLEIRADRKFYVLWNDGTVTTEIPKAPSDCPEDLDGDGVVGVADTILLRAAWGKCP